MIVDDKDDKAAEEAAAAEAAKEAEAKEAEEAAAAAKAAKDKDGEDEGEDDVKPDWKDRQMAKLRRQLAAKDAENVALKAAKPAPATKVEGEVAKPLTAEEREQAKAEGRQEAAAVAEQKAYDDKCNAMVDAGREAFEDFDKTLKKFVKLGGLPVLDRDYGLVKVALETDNPAKALYELAKDLDEAERIIELPQGKMLLALDKLARKKNTQSKVPNPLDTNQGGGESHGRDLGQIKDTKTWMVERDKQAKEGGRKRLQPLGAR